MDNRNNFPKRKETPRENKGKNAGNRSNRGDHTDSVPVPGNSVQRNGQKDKYGKRPAIKSAKTGKGGFSKDSKGIKPESGELRLNRFIAKSGICSRREADELIISGTVSVNGKVVTELGAKVTYADTVLYRGKKLSPEKKVYILLNKPKGYVTTVEDPHAEHTVIELLGDSIAERVYPVGRLDKETTGVLLLTNDGDLTKKLTHPKFERKKIYHVFLNKEITRNDIFKLAEGVDVEGEKIAADAVSSPDADDRTQIGIEIHSGQNRVIRKMMESMGYRVKKLDRVYFAGLTKKNVQRGKWRFLSEKEIIMLKRGIY